MRDVSLRWACALSGEVGEICNIIKKQLRGDYQDTESAAKARQAISDEIADVLTYLDLLAASMNIDLSEALIKKFNEVSKRRNSSAATCTVPKCKILIPHSHSI